MLQKKPYRFCHSGLDPESSVLRLGRRQSGFPLEFIPYLIRGGNDNVQVTIKNYKELLETFRWMSSPEGVKMILAKEDLAILDKFEFDVQPVGVKFMVKRPDMVERLNENMAFCEMLKRAQEGNAFFADQENHACEAGLYVLGQADAPEPCTSGEFGAGLKIFEEARSASRLYQYIPRIGEGVANYVAFSPLSKLPFDPDVLIILAKTSQTEILLRAMSYRTGKMWLSKYSPAIGCAWIYVYPYVTGELNYTITGLGHGMRRRKLFPEGHQLVSIPFDLLPSMLQALRDMPWVLPAYETDGPEFVRRLLVKLGIAPPQ